MLLISTCLITSLCLFTIPFIQYRLTVRSPSDQSNETIRQTLNATLVHFQRCRQFDHYVWQNFVSLPLALVITLICSCLKRRETFCLQFCHGRPSLPMPLNLYDKRQRHVIAAIFGISANEVLKILEELLLRFSAKNVTENEGIIIELLKRIGTVLLIGMRYFPLLIRSVELVLCLRLPDVCLESSVNIIHPISYALGLLYTLIDGTYTLMYASYCSRVGLIRFGRTLFPHSSSDDINWPDLIYVVLRHLPHFTFISFVLVKFSYLFVEQMKLRCCPSSPITDIHHRHQRGKGHQVSLVSSTLSTDIVTPDYQTKPEYSYTRGKSTR